MKNEFLFLQVTSILIHFKQPGITAIPFILLWQAKKNKVSQKLCAVCQSAAKRVLNPRVLVFSGLQSTLVT